MVTIGSDRFVRTTRPVLPTRATEVMVLFCWRWKSQTCEACVYLGTCGGTVFYIYSSLTSILGGSPCSRNKIRGRDS